MRTAPALLAVPAVFALAACGGGSPEPAEDIACESVDQAVLNSIAAGAEEDTGELTINRGSAYKSPNYGNVYFVAAEFSAAGVDKETGVWALNSIDPAEPGIIVAADAFAQGFTVYPDGDTMANSIPKASDDIDNARACLAQTS